MFLFLFQTLTDFGHTWRPGKSSKALDMQYIYRTMGILVQSGELDKWGLLCEGLCTVIACSILYPSNLIIGESEGLAAKLRSILAQLDFQERH